MVAHATSIQAQDSFRVHAHLVSLAGTVNSKSRDVLQTLVPMEVNATTCLTATTVIASLVSMERTALCGIITAALPLVPMVPFAMIQRLASPASA